MNSLLNVSGKTCRVTLSTSDKEGVASQLSQTLADAVSLVKRKAANQVRMDFAGITSLSQSDMRIMTVTGIALRNAGTKFYGENVTPHTRGILKSQGLSDLFVFVEQPPSKPAGINAEFVNAFINGAMETLMTQCSLETHPGQPLLRRDYKPTYAVSIMGVIGLTSAAFSGSIVLCFSEQTFLKIMEKMLGEPFSEITPELRDGAGELLNIIFGVAKVALNKAGLRIEKAIPTVIHGKDIETNPVQSASRIVLPFTSDVGGFHLEIGLEEQEGGVREDAAG